MRVSNLSTNITKCEFVSRFICKQIRCKNICDGPKRAKLIIIVLLRVFILRIFTNPLRKFAYLSELWRCARTRGMRAAFLLRMCKKWPLLDTTITRPFRARYKATPLLPSEYAKSKIKVVWCHCRRKQIHTTYVFYFVMKDILE